MGINNDKVPTLHWFDQDLRLDDNPALEAAAAAASSLVCVYCRDPSATAGGLFGIPRLGSIRKRFLDQSLAALSTGLARSGQTLLQVAGAPSESLPKLIDDHRIQRVVRSRHFRYFEVRQWEQLRQVNPQLQFLEVDSYMLCSLL